MIGPLKEYAQLFDKEEKVDVLYVLRSDVEGEYNRTRTEESLQAMLERENLQLSFKSLDWWDRYSFNNTHIKFPEGSFGLNIKIKNTVILPQWDFVVYKNTKFDFQEVFLTSIALFSSAKVIITDRLHGSIFSFLLHIPYDIKE